MARVGTRAAAAKEEAAAEGAGLEQGTPRDAQDEAGAQGTKDGIHLTKPRTTIVDDYPARPYSEAVTVPHREILDAAGQTPVD